MYKPKFNTIAVILLLTIVIAVILTCLIQSTSTPNCPSEIPTINSWSCQHDYNLEILTFTAPLNALFGITGYSTIGVDRAVAFIWSAIINLPYYFLLSCLLVWIYGKLKRGVKHKK